MPTLSKILLALTGTVLALATTSCRSDSESDYPAPSAVDKSLTPETEALFHSIHRIGWDPDKIIFGQEFPLTYNRAQSFNTNLDESDLSSVVGDQPGLYGSDFHYYFPGVERAGNEREIQVAAVRQAYEAGAIITFDFHWSGKYSGDYKFTEKDGEILYNVVHNDDSRGDVTWFYQRLDDVLEIINDEVGVPIVFRPFHEMNGDWFWWGSKLKGGTETYKQAFRILVDYIRERSDLVLYCWSPDKGLATEYYPGDDYVDIIGMDAYDVGSVSHSTVEMMIGWLEDAVDFAQERGKVAAFTETGDRVMYPDQKPDWWTSQILEPILANPKTRQIAWILTWINAPWSGPYVPTIDFPEAAKDDFKTFYSHPVTLFQSEVAAEKVYQPKR